MLIDGDVEVPVISACPADIKVDTNPGVATASDVYQPPTATDNSGEVTVTCDRPFESEFRIGQTNVTCVATDNSGNEATCQFQIDVEGKKITQRRQTILTDIEN